MRKRKKARKKFWTVWRLIIAMSFCLNLFGAYTHISRAFARQPYIHKQAIRLTSDGVQRRVRLFGQKLGF